MRPRLTQLSAALKKAEITLAEAQRAYDQIAWRNDVGMTSEAAALQSATIDYESAKAGPIPSQPPVPAVRTSKSRPAASKKRAGGIGCVAGLTAAELATTQAQVVDAEATLADLQSGATDNAVRSAEITCKGR